MHVKQELHQRTVAHVLGEMSWLLTQSPNYSSYRLSDLEWMVMPAILLKQFKIFYDETQKPTAFATWAFVSEEIETSIKENVREKKPIMLNAEDWRSGKNLWLIDVVAPFTTNENNMMENLMVLLKSGLFKDKPFRFAKIGEVIQKEQLANECISEMVHA